MTQKNAELNGDAGLPEKRTGIFALYKEISRLTTRVIRKLQTDQKALKRAAVELFTTDTTQEIRKKREWEVSRLFGRVAMQSPEIVASYLVLLIFLPITRPFGSDASQLKILVSLLWFFGTIAHYFFATLTIKYIFYYVRFRFGHFISLIANVCVYSVICIITPIVVVSFFPEPVKLEVLQMSICFPLVIAIGAISTYFKYVTIEHPLFVPENGYRKLLIHVPLDKRGTVLSVSAEDHYIRIATTAGTALVRMAFTDALKLLASEKGDQCHRSHWVSFDAVQTLEKRSGGGCVAELLNGDRIPVSKSRAKEFQAILSYRNS